MTANLLLWQILQRGGVRPVLVDCMLLAARGMVGGHIHNLALPAEQIAALPVQIQRLSYQLACTYSALELTSISHRFVQIQFRRSKNAGLPISRASTDVQDGIAF